MKIHEYQAEGILKKYGVAVPRGEMAATREMLLNAGGEDGTGGRGTALSKGPEQQTAAHLAGEGARATRTASKSKAMCFPTRRTPLIRLDPSVAAISAAADFSGSGFDPSQTDSITSPVTRAASPRAMVSTSGSSGMN